MQEWMTKLNQLRDSMETVEKEEDAARLLIQGPALVTQFQSLVKNRRKNAQDFAVPVGREAT